MITIPVIQAAARVTNNTVGTRARTLFHKIGALQRARGYFGAADRLRMAEISRQRVRAIPGGHSQAAGKSTPRRKCKGGWKDRLSAFAARRFSFTTNSETIHCHNKLLRNFESATKF